ncbi:hypothetical protein QJS10_CPA10g00313 [Acorus calamus]|uniref:Uncharacterized protein n=1 Tax=Acorus calamus TaxID=4465 RepID=A0AAV9DZR5_ACOCL|nr:hypothetical protein QJS10_CPA10g00313 [Acorus calamus]
MPKGVGVQINCIRRRFLWQGVDSTGRKPTLVKWSSVCCPKQMGGLGVINLEHFNQVMPLKWSWQWLERREALWLRVGRYGEEGWFGHLPMVSPHATTLFKGLFGDELALLEAISWELGYGTLVRFWEDCWRGTDSLRSLFHVVFQCTSRREGFAREFWSSNASEWVLHLRRVLQEWEAPQLSSCSALLQE